MRIEGVSTFYSTLDPQPSFIIKANVLRGDGPYRLLLIKKRTIEPGITIPAGLLGTWVTTSGYVIAYFYLLNPISVVASSCTVNDVNVAMGDDYQMHQLKNTGDSTPPVAFRILLEGCGKNINKIQIKLSATTPIVDKDTGTVELDRYSTAKGIGLKITNGAAGNILMDKTYQLGSFTSGAETAEANLFASYTRIPGAEFRAGTANTSVNFVISYL
jgi:major type 1 subunit fimbrin (pilin)